MVEGEAYSTPFVFHTDTFTEQVLFFFKLGRRHEFCEFVSPALYPFIYVYDISAIISE